MRLPQLRRVRWGVRATLGLGVAASVAANILHALPNPISQIIAAWPPLALLLTVELISRVPVHRRTLAGVRLVATTAIAGIAAWVSYWHMTGVASHYGEDGAAAYLLPISVDGLVIVASVSLVELAGRIRAAQHPEPAPVGVSVPRRPVAEPAPATAHATPPPDPAATARPDTDDTTPPPAQPGAPGLASTTQGPAPGPDQPKPTADPDPATLSDTAAAVAYWYEQDPTMEPADIAARIGKSLRTVRRYLPPPQQTDPPAGRANGTTVPDLSKGITSG